MPRTAVEWTADTLMEVDTAVYFNGRGYVCNTEHTSTSPGTDYAAGHWDQKKLFNIGTEEEPEYVIYDQTEADISGNFIEGKALRTRS